MEKRNVISERDLKLDLEEERMLKRASAAIKDSRRGKDRYAERPTSK